jgi:succinate-semialdehyde dehydrogenase/glutarate-semialdehyde dehydrogenase
MEAVVSFVSINPYTGETVFECAAWDTAAIEQALGRADAAFRSWSRRSFAERAERMQALAGLLRAEKAELSQLITLEMGKRISEAEAEIEKCATVCEYYAEHAAQFLADEEITSDADQSFVAYQPLGPVLAVMPWNFPFWQVFRFAAPALMAGNVGLLKHASNVPQCALAMERLFIEAGFPVGVFSTLMIRADQVEAVIADDRVRAVTLTGSEPAGRKVAATAGKHLKKTVLELGGSDAFIVLEDCDFEAAVQTAVVSRFLNGGQSCIAAKRFILVPEIAERFVEAFSAGVAALRYGDPMDPETSLAPLARPDLRDELHKQVMDTIGAGAKALVGCAPIADTYAGYHGSLLDHVVRDMRAYEEELFGPVALVLRAANEGDTLRLANDVDFGLGGTVWTEDIARGIRVARMVESGAVFVNGLVKSDPRLPFGGIKNSGYGRELSSHGIHEFVNAKTIWVG